MSEQTPQGQSASYSYDLNGNVTQHVEGGQTTSYSWNSQDYLVSVAHPDGTRESYTYCGEGIRRTKSSNTQNTRFIRDGQNILLEVDAGSGTTQRRYTHQSDGWGTLLSLHQGQMSRYYGFDFIANTRLLTDENGGVSDSYLYSAFGEERQVSGSAENPLRFGGQVGYYRDEAKRLYVRARHLDVGAGRWLSRDPMEMEAGDTNFYRYVANNPVNEVDPSGLIVFGGAYGNCCGPLRRCGPTSPVIDCIDAACRTHDNCLATWQDLLNPCKVYACDMALGNSAWKCAVRGCTTISCRLAATQVSLWAGYSGMGFRIPPPTTLDPRGMVPPNIFRR